MKYGPIAFVAANARRIVERTVMCCLVQFVKCFCCRHARAAYPRCTGA